MGEKSLDPQLWQACAGGMVNIPPVNSKVFYFPQGHAEHAQSHVDFPAAARIPALILCRVTSLRFMADPDTDEVFAKIRLVPLAANDLDPDDENPISSAEGGREKPASFAKTLTQSDANNGGGFSVPRYCAETIFPRLDYAADPPVQNVIAKDVHGGVWKFRHIYRGTPRRHLLTTGWSNFVNQKKLVAGDSIVFLRSESGEICVGIRRAKRGIGLGPEQPQHSGWSYGGAETGRRAAMRPEAVVEAAVRAANGHSFEVSYHPRVSTPEFCVRVSAVRAAMRVQWCPGMRFKMAFETEDSSRISWFMGTVSAVHVADPIWWPHSPWRLLQVAWDEPDLLQNVKRVNPWLVESVSNVPPVLHLASFSPPRKKLRMGPAPPFFLDHHIHNHYPNTSTPSGIQGARHALFGISLSDLHQTHNQFNHGYNNRHHFPAVVPKTEALSCLLSIGSSPPKRESRQFVLFGQPILTEQQMSEAAKSEEDSETGHCKVFMESEDVGRTLDLSLLASYDDLYRRLAGMFSVDVSELQSHVCYHDSAGALKRTGDDPFSDFVRTAKRLTIVSDSRGVGGTRITGMRSASNNGLGASNKTGPLSIFA